MPLLKPSMAIYIYTWATGHEFYTKEISYRTGTKTYEDTETKALDMMLRPLTKDHIYYPISVSGIENWPYCHTILRDFGFSSIKTHDVTAAEDRILNRVFWTSYNLGVDYETEPTRHDKDPFNVF